MRTANLAIVFTDIKGFTERTSQQTLGENEQLLKTHNELLAPLFKGFGGRIVKTIGDAFLVTFESPTSAVLSGLAAQDALWAYNRGVAPEKQLHVRVAINVGEVRLENNDVFGEPVNIAARVEGLAEAGEVTFTEAVYLSMNRAEVAAEDLGKHELKGIPEPVRVYRATKVSTVEAPFGNKALDRLTQGQRTSSGSHKALELASSALATTTEVAGKALATTGEVATKALETTSKLVQGAQKRGLPRWWIPAAVVAGLALLVVGAVFFGKNDTEQAIEDAIEAKPEQRRARIDAAKKLIADEKEQKLKSWYLGTLSEGLEENAAVGHYAAAAKLGLKKAEDKLLDLLEHKKCGLRAGAADALADLKVKRARGRLETLADEGGPDDGEQVLIFGCNSKQAASQALARLRD